MSEEGYHGIGVHRAARIMAAGHGGQVLLSEATAAVLRDEEVAGVNARDLGVHRLKDLDRPEHVYQLVADGLEPSFPKIRTAGQAAAVLPAAARHRRHGRRARRGGRDPRLRTRRRLRRQRVRAEGRRRGQRRRRRRRELAARCTSRRPASTSRTALRQARARSGSPAAAGALPRSIRGRIPSSRRSTSAPGPRASPSTAATSGSPTASATPSPRSRPTPSTRSGTTRSGTRRRAWPSATAPIWVTNAGDGTITPARSGRTDRSRTRSTSTHPFTGSPTAQTRSG